jgi:hypothetical protein
LFGLIGRYIGAGAFSGMTIPPGISYIARKGNLSELAVRARRWRDEGCRRLNVREHSRALAGPARAGGADVYEHLRLEAVVGHDSSGAAIIDPTRLGRG